MNLVFYQSGYFHGVDTALQCAKENSGCEIIFVSDKHSPVMDKTHNLEWHNKVISEFRTQYRHQSDSEKEWQFQTIVRWLVLAELTKEQSITPFWYVDTDVLVFGDISKRPLLGDIGCIKRMSAGTSYWANGATLNLFAEYIRSFYRKWDHGIPSGTRICDMTILAEFLNHYRNAVNVDELTSVYNGTTFDNNPTTDLDTYASDGKFKKYEFVSGIPRVTLRSGGSSVMFNTIHCWWEFKHRMQELYDASKASKSK